MAAEQVVIPGMESLAVRESQAPTPMVLLQMAMSQNADIEKLTRLMELQERWEANEARKAFNFAMAKFKENPPKIQKNKHVKFGTTEYNHATLDHVTAQVTSALSAVGIGHKYTVLQNGPAISVTCILTHEQGHSESTSLTASPDTSGSKNSIQAIGSSVTYLQRYTLLLACGMAASEDTDGVVVSEELKQYIEIIKQSATQGELKSAYVEALKHAKTNPEKVAVMNAKDEKAKEF